MKIILTGSSSGIGKWVAEFLSANNHEIWGLSRSPQNEKFRTSICDVSNWNQTLKVAQEVKSTWKSVDALICAAGSQGAIGPAMALDPLIWSNTVSSNLNSTFFPIRAFFESFSSHAKVICFSGGGSTQSRPNYSAYGVAKTAIVRLVENLADEWSEKTFDINAIAPGAFYTRMTEETIALGPQVVGQKEYDFGVQIKNGGSASRDNLLGLINFLLSQQSNGLRGRLISALWDDWQDYSSCIKQIGQSDSLKLRRTLFKTPNEM